MPYQFISLAEKYHWIGELTQKILESASSRPEIRDAFDLAINISPIQFRDLSLPRQIRSVAERTGFPLERLIIEVTESALTDNLVQALALAKELKALGCRLALDDFGIGYSNLLQLQSLPFDELKLDRNFVQFIATKPESRKIVAAMVDLGHSLGWTTVAEGVETAEQEHILLHMGCELVQGSLYGMPFPAAELADRIAAPARPREQACTPKRRGEAALLVEPGATRELIGASLLRLGFSVAQVVEPAQQVNVERALACDLIVVGERHADGFRTSGSYLLTQPHRLLPPIAMVRLEGSTENAQADLDFDGIIQLPLRSEEVSQMLLHIFQVHRSVTLRYLPMLNRLNFNYSVMEAVTNGVSISDALLPDMPLIYVNPAFEKMTGYTSDEILGRNCRFLQGPETQQPALESLRSAIREHRETTTVLRNYRKDGTPFWNELSLSALRDLGGRVTHFVGIQSDVTQRVEFEQRWSFLAHHDQLTGLANRRLLFDRIQQAIMRASRSDLCVALLFFDLNNFKHVNDVFGHDAGDELLRMVGERLQMEVRECDTVARLGGDEFVIVIPDLENEETIRILLRRLKARLSEKIVIRGQEFRPTASAGFSLYPPDGADLEELLKVADMRMYADKHKSRQEECDGGLHSVPSVGNVPSCRPVTKST